MVETRRWYGLVVSAICITLLLYGAWQFVSSLLLLIFPAPLPPGPQLPLSVPHAVRQQVELRRQWVVRAQRAQALRETAGHALALLVVARVYQRHRRLMAGGPEPRD